MEQFWNWLREKNRGALLLLAVSMGLFLVREFLYIKLGENILVMFFVPEFTIVESALVLGGIVIAWLTLHKSKNIDAEQTGGRFWLWLVVLIMGMGIIGAIKNISGSVLFDEQYQLSAVKGILRTGLPTMPSGVLYVRDLPYSYMTALIVWLNHGRFTMAAGRLVSLIYFVVSLPLLWLSFRRIFNTRAAMFSLITYAWSYNMMYLAKFARGYMGLAFFSLLGAISLYRAVFLNERKWVWGFWLSMLAAPLHHNPGIWLMGLIPLLFIKTDWKMKKRQLGAVLLIGLIFAGLAVWSGNKFGSWLTFVGELRQNILFPPSIFDFEYYLFLYPWMFLIFAVGLVYNLKQWGWRSRKNYFHYILGLLIVASSFYKVPWRPSYMLWIYPFFVIGFGYGMDILLRLAEKTLKMPAWKLLTVAMILVLGVQVREWLLMMKTDYGTIMPRFKISNSQLYVYPDYESVAEYVEKHVQPGDVVIVAERSPMLYQFYLDDREDYYLGVFDSPYTNVASIDSVELLMEIMSKNLAEGKKVWILTDFITDPDCKYVYCLPKDGGYGEFGKLMDHSRDKIQYVSRDGISKAYLFDAMGS